MLSVDSHPWTEPAGNAPRQELARVMSGAVRISKLLDDGRRQVTAFHLPGEIFGLELGKEHRFSAEAISESSILVVKFSQISGNTANGGPMAGAGGISNGGTATITASQVSGNTAPGGAGGGILNHGVLTLTGSKVTGNTAPADSAGDQGMGGGIANINLGQVAPGAVNGGILTITFSQISRNTASGQGGGIIEATISANGTPAAGGPLTLKFSKVTGNKAGQGGGIFAVPGSPVTLKFTVVAKNIPDNCAPPGTIAGCKN